MEYVYVLVSEGDGQFYTGLTSDLRKRLNEHNAGLVESTKHRVPLRLGYYEACLSRSDASAREKYLKSGMGKRYLKNRFKNFLGGGGPLETPELLTGCSGSPCRLRNHHQFPGGRERSGPAK